MERLHDEIDPQSTYPLDYIIYRLMRYRRDSSESVLLIGEALLPDLRLMIDTLSRSADLPIGADPGTRTAEQLAQQFDVSTKTITRWRKAGLRWRWVVPDNGRKQVGFTAQAVERFVAANRERVERASSFSQIEPQQRRQILDRARRIARGREVSLNQVAVHLAHRTGRALETIRQILEQHERQHPDNPIFAIDRSPLSPREKRIIARAYRMGVGVSRIAQHYNRTRSTIYRIISERRAAAANRMRLTWIASPIFTRDDADEVILRGDADPYPADQPRIPSSVPIDDLPKPLRPLYRQPPIQDKRQRSLFVRYNYLKFKAAKIQRKMDRYDPRVADLNAFEGCLKQARQIRDVLVKANLSVVLSVTRRHLVGRDDRSTHRLLSMLELGVPILIESVDRYNAARSQTFASFLTNRLMQEFAALDAPQHPDRPQRAQRRMSAEQLLRRMVDQANESGVELSLDGEK